MEGDSQWAGKKQTDTSRYFCPNETCTNHGRVGPNNHIISSGRYGKKKIQLL
ncbi:MAG: hypothetical protein KIH10_12710 [Candidatus Freyarchaeota archaeon]|nr:hypothetical protein [Candidatus Jordarchaeia archaeon]MBS7279573.1 hypothetical protein [Candidatus Jordarchaeia archaeon]